MQFLLIFLVSVYAHSQTIVDKLKSKPVITGAHQGGTYSGAPNTLGQFKKAMDAGIDIVEMDIRITSDQVPMILHDATLDSKTNCKGPIAAKTYEQVKNCKVKNSNEFLPSFEDVLKMVNGNRIINAEFKIPDVVEPAIAMVQKYKAHEWVFFQTKAIPDNYYRARAFDAYVALNFKTVDLKNLEWAVSLNDPRLIVVEMEKEMITPKHIKIAHDYGKLILTNSWRYAFHEEVLGATCTQAWKHGADIASSNQPAGCVAQQKSWKP